MTACTASPQPDLSRAVTVDQIEQALNEGDLAFASTALQPLQGSSDDLRVLELAARLYALTGNATALQEVTERILEIDPTRPSALEQLGLLRLSAGDQAGADNYLALAVAMEPSRWMAWNGLGIVADLQSRFDEARDNFERALAIVPGHPKVLANLGWSRLLADDLEEAESLLRSAIELAPDSATTQSNLAFCIALQGRYEEAMVLYEAWYDRPVAANNVGYAAGLRDDRPAARKYLSMALELQPNYYRKAANNLADISP